MTVRCVAGSLRRPIAAALVLLGVAALAGQAEAITITKLPDVGAYWHPLGATEGTYVYANSFVAPENGLVTSLGLWLTTENDGTPPGPDVVFQVLASKAGDPSQGPDTTSVFAASAIQSGLGVTALALYTAPTLAGGVPLVAGTTYWFAASTVGLSGSGEFQVGGHTQNSGGIVDNGTFWYSNDPAGIDFDGTALTPEMAFTVTTVPEPASLALLGAGLVGLVVRRRRSS